MEMQRTSTLLTAHSRQVAKRVKQIRQGAGWSVAELASRCHQAGAPGMTVNVLFSIESGRPRDGRPTRMVDVDELLVLSVALGVSPVDLLLPDEDGAGYAVTPLVSVDADRAWRWIGGTAFLVEPTDGAELADALRPLPSRRAALLNAAWWEKAGRRRSASTSKQVGQ